MLVITPLTIGGLPLMNFISTFSHLSQSNKKLSVMCWLILCTFNIKSLNLWCFFFMRLFFMTCILQFWRMPDSKSEMRIFRQSHIAEEMILSLYKPSSQFELTFLWCIDIRQSPQRLLIIFIHWFCIFRVISVKSCKMKFWYELLLQWLGT